VTSIDSGTVASRDGTTIAYDRRGTGPLLVLVGGAFQYRAFDPRTQELADRLADRRTVVTYDRRGRGQSGDTAPYAPEREVEDLAAVIAGNGERADVFAMSSGGALALDAAAAGVPIRRLALYEPPFIVDDSRAPLPADYVERLERADPDEAVAYFLTTAALLPKDMVAGMRQSPAWSGLTAVARTLAYDGALVHDVSRGTEASLQRWASVTTPVLVAVGGASTATFHRAAEALARALPAGEHAIVPGQAHDADPGALAPVVDAHLSQATG
jgi:pimeloyl-ACP methyl ester carboxylesterase